VIDDNSTTGNVPYLLDEWRQGRVQNLLLHGQRTGAMANLNQGAWMAFSDPVVFTDDDILCPDLNPDWLAQGLEAMRERPDLVMMALNHPNMVRRVYDKDDKVTYCYFVGGTFMFVRRKFLQEYPLPHFRDNFGRTPTTKRCQMAKANNLKVGYLTNVYCQHIGKDSAIAEGTKHNWHNHIDDVDPITLEPRDKQWRK